ncbi:MAG: DUF2760 domain-containing protein, partial [Acidobacteriia bacterium]|nr:DUF2760 domain-containing protein [Terriglobia bacterium]
MNRILLAFKCFFNILFGGQLSETTATELGLARRAAATPAPAAPAVPAGKPSDGALQILSIMQRDSRLLDFLMEDLSSYTDDQIGAAVRELHDQCRDS